MYVHCRRKVRHTKLPGHGAKMYANRRTLLCYITYDLLEDEMRNIYIERKITIAILGAFAVNVIIKADKKSDKITKTSVVETGLDFGKIEKCGSSIF